jgi:hypothetical protein
MGNYGREIPGARRGKLKLRRAEIPKNLNGPEAQAGCMNVQSILKI